MMLIFRCGSTCRVSKLRLSWRQAAEIRRVLGRMARWV